MSGTRVLLDTNIVLYVLNGDEQIAELIQGSDVYLSVITRVELFSKGKMDEEEKDAIAKFIADGKLVQFGPEIQERTIALRQRFKLKLPDAAIAATASYLGVQLITSDTTFSKLADEIAVLIVER